MANGIPPLLNNLIIAIPNLLSADILIGLPSFGQQWGVFLGGAPIIIFDTFVSIDYRQTWNISDYPVEKGGFESYNKVYTPFETRVRFASGGSEANRTALLASIAAISGTLQLYTVVTPEAIYQSVNVKHYDYHRTATNGVGLLTVDLWLEEVRETVSETATTTAGTGTGSTTDTGGTAAPSAAPDVTTNPIDPSGANPVNNGATQSYTPTPAEVPAWQGNSDVGGFFT